MQLECEDIPDLARPPLPSALTPQEELAIASWRRARDTTDPTLAVGALFEALECYAFDVPLPDLFTETEEESVRAAALQGLTPEQRRRVEGKLHNLNQAFLFDVLKEAFRVDQVSVTASEVALLRTLRNQRNDFVHGRGVVEPDLAEVRYGIAILGRALLFRVRRRSRDLLRNGVMRAG